MGWTSYNATHYYKNGSINRKAECDSYFTHGLNRGFYEVVRSSMKGSVYYAAIRKTKRYVLGTDGKRLLDGYGQDVIEYIPEKEREVFGVIFLTSVRGNQFFYKPISEDMGPRESNCPRSIINLLSATNNKYANEWRERCLKNSERVKLSSLPIGAEIECVINGKTVVLRKSASRYQFKTPFWINDANLTYVPKKNIPGDFKVIDKSITLD